MAKKDEYEGPNRRACPAPGCYEVLSVKIKAAAWMTFASAAVIAVVGWYAITTLAFATQTFTKTTQDITANLDKLRQAQINIESIRAEGWQENYRRLSEFDSRLKDFERRVPGRK